MSKISKESENSGITNGKEVRSGDLLSGLSIHRIADSVCKHLPEDYVIRLCLEKDSAWVELIKRDRATKYIKLPGSTDKALYEQINDAVCVANGYCR